MSIDSKIIDRLEELIQFGKRVNSGVYEDHNTHYYKLNDQHFSQWAASSLNLLGRVFGIASIHYKSFQSVVDSYGTAEPVENIPPRGLGVLLSAQDDYENGYLFDTRALIEAEVFDDFLEQAEHLHTSGYHASAAVIVGCVLEDGLRKACGREGISLPTSPKLDWMNAELAKQGVYSKLVQKQITALAGIRNEAAHGNWTAFTKDDVTGMISQVRAITATHLS